MTSDMKSFGKKLAERRKALGISTQEAMATLTGVQRKRVNQMENGRYTGRITDLLRVMDQLGLALDAKVAERPTLENLNELFPEDE